MKKNIYFFIMLSSFLYPQQWQMLNGPYGGEVKTITVNPNGNLYAARSEAIYKSTDEGESWVRLQNNPSNINFLRISSNGTLFAGVTFRGVWWSFNDGVSWGSNQITHSPHSGLGASIYNIGLFNNIILTESFKSTNGGQTWQDIGAGGKSYVFRTNDMLAGTYNNGVKKSTDGGNTWFQIGSGTLSVTVNSLIELSNGNLLAGTAANGIYVSEDDGNSWIQVNSGLLNNNILTLVAANNVIYAGTSGGIYASFNNGLTWNFFGLENLRINSLLLRNEKIYAATNTGLYVLSNGEWLFKNNGMHQALLKINAEDGGELFAASGSNFYYSSNNGNSWQIRNNGLSSLINDFTFANNVLYAALWDQGVYKSTNKGLSWIPENNGIPETKINSVTTSDNIIFILSEENSTKKLYRSSNDGESWQLISIIDSLNISASIAGGGGGKILAATLNMFLESKLYYSTNYGSTWNEYLFNTFSSIEFAKYDNAGKIYALFRNGEIHYSDNGIEWTLLPNIPWTTAPYDFSFTIDDKLFASTRDGIFYTPDMGTTWDSFNNGLPIQNNYYPLSFISITNENLLYAGTYYHGIYLNNQFFVPVELASFTAGVSANNVMLSWSTATETNNSGFTIERQVLRPDSWKSIGFVEGKGTTTEIQNYFYEDRNVTSGKYKYRLKQIDFDGSYSYSNEVEVNVGLPDKFSLSQNYPNPFNPTTKIKYNIPAVEIGHAPSLQRVMLKIYNILGNEITSLVNEMREPGEYEVEWNAANISSGVYFYKITAGSFSEVKKMVMMK